MKISKYIFITLICLIKVATATAAGEELHVQVSFTYKDTDLRMEMYEALPEYTFSVARTAVANSMARAPLGKKLSLPVKLKESESKTFVLVVRNTSDRTRYFFAAPHTVHPSHGSLDALFECLCNHHVYPIPPGKVWYRVVRLKFENEKINWKGVRKIDMNHNFVEIPEKKALRQYKHLFYDISDSNPEKDL